MGLAHIPGHPKFLAKTLNRDIIVFDKVARKAEVYVIRLSKALTKSKIVVW